MKIFTSADINPMSWEEYGNAIQSLLEKIRASAVSFDAVAPVLRSGAIPGSALAVTLGIPTIIALQFKYLHHPTRLEQVTSLPCLPDLPAHPNILICENNTSSGNTARAAISLLKEQFPNGKLWYATVAKVCAPDAFEHIEQHFVGVHTDEQLMATPAEIVQLGLRRGVTLFPWENAQDELDELNRA